jgi:uncharacterized OsmC-like protein
MHAHTVLATRISGALGEAHAREVLVPIETATAAGRDDALSPIELLLAAVAGGVLSGVEQAATVLSFQLASASVEVCGVCGGQHATPGLAVEYDLTIETAETDGRLVQFHELVRHADALLHLGDAGAHLTGRVRRLRPATSATASPNGASPNGTSPAARGAGAGSAGAAAASRRP